jgi:hypothetical protein
MKITKDDGVRNIIPNVAPKNATKDAANFSEILHRTLEKGLSSPGAAAARVSSPAGASPIDTATLLGIDSARIIDGADRLIGTLEEFQKKLADTSLPVEELSPIVERMSREKDLLIPTFDALPQSDPLRDILNKVLIAVSVEAEKFKRGDYL